VRTNNSHSGILRSSFLTRHSSLATTLKFFPFKFLRTLLHGPKTQLFSFQSLPHSLPKNTRGGGTAANLRQSSGRSRAVGLPRERWEPRRFFSAKEHSRRACQIAEGLLFGVV